MINNLLLKKLEHISPEEEAILDGNPEIRRAIYMQSGSDVIDAKKLLDSGRLIAIRPHTRFAHFPEHSHNYVEVVYMCHGTTTHIANGKAVTLHPGELLFLGQGARQEILPAGKDDIAVNFIILPQFFDKALEMLDEGETPLRKFIVDSLRGNNANCLYFQVADVLPVQNLVENLIWSLLGNPSPNRRSICQTTMGLLFMQLMNHTDIRLGRVSFGGAEAHGSERGRDQAVHHSARDVLDSGERTRGRRARHVLPDQPVSVAL